MVPLVFEFSHKGDYADAVLSCTTDPSRSYTLASSNTNMVSGNARTLIKSSDRREGLILWRESSISLDGETLTFKHLDRNPRTYPLTRWSWGEKQWETRFEDKTWKVFSVADDAGPSQRPDVEFVPYEPKIVGKSHKSTLTVHSPSVAEDDLLFLILLLVFLEIESSGGGFAVVGLYDRAGLLSGA